MLLIQQSSTFRLWTSRALMVYIRRALVFLVLSPRQRIPYEKVSKSQENDVYFSDAEDSEDELITNEDRHVSQCYSILEQKRSSFENLSTLCSIKSIEQHNAILSNSAKKKLEETSIL